jgi:SAM-dependent methyltransferase
LDEKMISQINRKIRRAKEMGLLWTIRRGKEKLRDSILSISEKIWYRLPEKITNSRPFIYAGKVIHRKVCMWQKREPWALYTRFFRNRSQLEVLCNLISQRPLNSALKLAVLGCSTGAEVYSIIYFIKDVRPDIRLHVAGIDISEEAIQKAKTGIYTLADCEVQHLSEEEAKECFIKYENDLEIEPTFKKDVRWLVDDAGNPALIDFLGPQDIVFASNFLVHWPADVALNCLLNICKLVTPGGYLFILNVDLDVKQKVGRLLNLSPVLHNIEAVYADDERALYVWPWKYWGVEKIDKNRNDWEERYASVYQIPIQ